MAKTSCSIQRVEIAYMLTSIAYSIGYMIILHLLCDILYVHLAGGNVGRCRSCSFSTYSQHDTCACKCFCVITYVGLYSPV